MNALKFNPTTVSIDLGGTPISIETGRIAKQAAGSVIVRQGDTMVLVAVCVAEPREGIDFFPLTVDYREPVFSAGKIPGGFFKREGKQTTKETLVSRLIDRPLRPLFEEGYNGDTVITAQVISFDGDHQPDVLAMVGASAALIISEIPFNNPVGGVRVGRVDGKFVINPTVSQRPDSDLDLLVAGTEDALVMVECGASEFQEAEMVKALEFGHANIKTLVKLQKELRAKVGKTKMVAVKPERNEEIYKLVASKYAEKLLAALTMKVKIESYKAIDALKKEAVAELTKDKPELKKDVVESFDTLKETLFRNAILKQGARLDGRKFDQIRPLNIEVGVLPAAHGSCLFTRGETQALVTATLGTADDIQHIDGIEDEYDKRFYLHYNFPGYSVGECKPNRGPGRREIGHGMLAERSIFQVLPSKEENPYTLRVVSEITESNGSSSMATICGGTLALMDAGIKLSSPVAGVAMGLVSDGEKFVVLTDIAGQEDHYGDMDFKVAGTTKGITALQMDIKIGGITTEILTKALDQAKKGRLELLESMGTVLAAPRTEYAGNAPQMHTLQLPKEKIRDVIGKGGAVIRNIIEVSGCQVNIDDDGSCQVAGPTKEKLAVALKMIGDLIQTAEVGQTYLGRVAKVVEFGAFVTILPGLDGLLHVSEMAPHRVKNPADEVSEGQEIMVKCIAVDANGKIKLSRKALLASE
ncbi:polyribonucleotide nucleotidyltransferase [Mesoterricola silvestris]|uniref:Polyribonucleotide nucleotidyltransferase n=1 Tax=Mesoterricola silvestris TaxID=2927979 RepID=A0AA48GEJ3_9BACT|nr:polyribonucleotide nucleotidyltransferase [Mesoterricola silvestris]BDU71081.1 polyribonucleotide nucleotidyltransferase [Mesoterricola silvestris]